MIYVWKCERCGTRIDVSRLVAERERPPTNDESVHECLGDTLQNTGFVRVITAPRNIKVIHTEWTANGKFSV